MLVITFSVLSLTALSILYSLNTVSESSSQNGSSHGTSIINQEMNEHVIKVDFDLFLIIEMLLIVCGDVELNPGPITNDVSCSKCNLTFSTPQKMSIHEKRVHDDRVLKCDKCEKVLIGKMNYINHQASHKSSQCKVCGLWLKVNSSTIFTWSTT